MLCGEEIAYTLFTLAQFLGFLEVVRREGPRERSFLAAGTCVCVCVCLLCVVFVCVLVKFCVVGRRLRGWRRIHI